jgi:hypothetical protein
LKKNSRILSLRLGSKGQGQNSRKGGREVHGATGIQGGRLRKESEDDGATLQTASRAKVLYGSNAQRQAVVVLQTYVGQVERIGALFDPYPRASPRSKALVLDQ